MVLLSEDEKKIMRAVCGVKQNSQTIRRLEADLAMPEGQVKKLVNSLIDKKLVFLSQPKQHGNRYLRLTDKGESYALVHCGISFDTMTQNHPYIESQNVIKGMRSAVKTEELRTLVSQYCTNYLIQKNLFTAEGRNIMTRSSNKWEARNILIEWTKHVKNLSVEYPGDIDVKKWAKFVHIFDDSIKVDGILGTNMDKGMVRIVSKS